MNGLAGLLPVRPEHPTGLPPTWQTSAKTNRASERPNLQEMRIPFKLARSGAEELGVTILEIPNLAPMAGAAWPAPVVTPVQDDLALIPDCEWESKFSSVVDTICRSYNAVAQPSFLSMTFE